MMDNIELIERLERKRSVLVLMEFKLTAGSALEDAVSELRKP